VADVHGTTTLLHGLARQTLGGKAALALWRTRRGPAAAARSARLARADRAAGRIPPQDPRREFRAVYLVPAGPGEHEGLHETIASIRRYEGDDVKIVVTDDCTVDCREALVRERWPEVTVLRPRWPAGSPLRLAPLLTRAYAYALDAFRFDVLCKIDADALVTGPGLTAGAAELFAREPSVGALGTCRTRADGVDEDYTYDAWVLAHERRWSREVRALHDAARAGGYDGAKVHGGVYLLARRGLEAARTAGWLPWAPPWWTLLGEDTVVSLILWASGLSICSWGAPGEPTASGQGFLPIDKESVMREGKLAIHSVRRGINGETERELRAFFRAEREAA
jgi:hypothetical protein